MDLEAEIWTASLKWVILYALYSYLWIRDQGITLLFMAALYRSGSIASRFIMYMDRYDLGSNPVGSNNVIKETGVSDLFDRIFKIFKFSPWIFKFSNCILQRLFENKFNKIRTFYLSKCDFSFPKYWKRTFSIFRSMIFSGLVPTTQLPTHPLNFIGWVSSGKNP